jgi:hypothetical protein
MLLAGAREEVLGSRSGRRASFELSGEQVSDVTHIEVNRSLRDGGLRFPQVSFGCDDESLKLTFLIACAFDQTLRLMSKVGELFGRKPERHSSRSSAVAIRSRNLGG